MKYLVVGMNRNFGISSKNGQSYDLTFLHCVCDAAPYKGSGKIVRELTCGSSIIPDGLSVGDVCEIFFDELKRPSRIFPVANPNYVDFSFEG